MPREAEPGEVRVVSWNVNGLRSLGGGLESVASELSASLLCVQETKLSRESLDSGLGLSERGSLYFSFCRSRPGYSGVATFAATNATPAAASDGLGASLRRREEGDEVGGVVEATEVQGVSVRSLDAEGRALLSQHRFALPDSSEIDVVFINVYCPRWDGESEERLAVKMAFYELLEERARKLVASGVEVVILGDLNASPGRLDTWQPDADPLFDQRPHRVWLRRLIGLGDGPAGFVDLFRHFHPDQPAAYTCWNTQLGNRPSNLGTRIDFFLPSANLVHRLAFFSDCEILHLHPGSDHCPIVATLSSGVRPLPASRPPSLATKWMPELRGSQTSLRSFLSTAPPPLPQDQPPPRKRPKPSKAQTSIGQFFTKPEKPAANCAAAESGCKPSTSQPSLPAAVKRAAETQSASQPSPSTSAAVSDWRALFSRGLVRRKCGGHGEEAVWRRVKKKGLNQGRRFWVCAHPPGLKGDPQAACDYFAWDSDPVSKPS